MSWRTLVAMLGVLALFMTGCDENGPGDDDDNGDDDDTADDDTGDDDTGFSDPSCEGIYPPGYAGTNGFHVVLDDETDLVVDNESYRHEISATSGGLFIDHDNGTPPGTPVNGQDWYLFQMSASPSSVVSAGEQELQSNHELGPRVVLTVVPNYPEGASAPHIFAINPAFPDSEGTINCTQSPSTGSPFQCTYEATLIWSEQDIDTGDLYVAGCAGISGAYDFVLDAGI